MMQTHFKMTLKKTGSCIQFPNAGTRLTFDSIWVVLSTVNQLIVYIIAS